MKILVTGGAGFLGSHLCDRLLEQGNEVICLDNFYTGSKKNIEHNLNNSKFELIEHDVVDPIKVEVDKIFNLACPASPKAYQKDPVITIKTCVYGSINMLDLAVKLNASILQASTSEIYGDPKVHPQSEVYRGNVNPIGPRACYDEGKRCAETLFFDYYRKYGLDIKLIRIFNTYGPRMNKEDGRVVSNFIYQALNNKDITIYGDGSQTRSFCFVSDLINGMISFMFNSKLNGPVNIGNPTEFTIYELATLIIQMTGSKSKIIFEKLPVDDPLKRKPDIGLIQEAISWNPKINLKTGIMETIKYWDSNLNKSRY